MMLIEASWPSNRLAAVTKRTGWTGTWRGFRSAMLVPLSTGGSTLGAITLVSAESGRRFTTDDLALAEELARRAALALQNARLALDVPARGARAGAAAARSG